MAALVDGLRRIAVTYMNEWKHCAILFLMVIVYPGKNVSSSSETLEANNDCSMMPMKTKGAIATSASEISAIN